MPIDYRRKPEELPKRKFIQTRQGVGQAAQGATSGTAMGKGGMGGAQDHGGSSGQGNQGG